jgi:hypothetical protein
MMISKVAVAINLFFDMKIPFYCSCIFIYLKPNLIFISHQFQTAASHLKCVLSPAFNQKRTKYKK